MQSHLSTMRPHQEAGHRRAFSKTVVLGRTTAVTLIATASALALWAVGTTWYIGARDDLAQRFFTHQAEVQYGYENRIEDLKARLEREVTRNLVERNGVDEHVRTLQIRQGEIETRQAWIRGAIERQAGSLTSGSVSRRLSGEIEITSPLPLASERPVPDVAGAKPAPISDLTPFQLRESEPTGRSRRPLPVDRLSALQDSLDVLSHEESRILRRLAGQVRDRLARFRSALAGTGIDLASETGGLGGPLVPITIPSDRAGFVFEIEAGLTELDRYSSARRTLPLGLPVGRTLEQTSGFGYRVDPFTRSAAMHTGLDFRVEHGTPIRATGAGRVAESSHHGGYGLMVEIDHGRGVTTRYAHLSELAVMAGDRIESGQIVGRAGSTGRSTGPHLHYETRVNGEPVDPQRFLQTGTMLAGLGALSSNP